MTSILAAAAMTATALLVVVALWQVVKLRKPGGVGPAPQVQDMTRRVAELRARMDALADPREAGARTLGGLPSNTAVDDAAAAYLAAVPHAGLAEDGDVLKHRFSETNHPPFLAALAGLALREPELPHTARPTKTIRAAVAHVLRTAPPSLAAHLAERLLDDDLDRWRWLAGDGLILQEVAAAAATEDADAAERLRSVDEILVAHRTRRRIEEAERQLAFYEGRDRVDSTYEMATEFVRWSLLPAPRMYERFDRLVESNSTHFEWRELRLQMDLILIEGGLHRDATQALQRLEKAFDDSKASVTEIAADVAADLIEQDLLDEDALIRMRRGLDHALARHRPPSPELLRLSNALGNTRRVMPSRSLGLEHSHAPDDPAGDRSQEDAVVPATDPYNAFLNRPEPAVENASDGPLQGLTMAVKDIFDITGQRSGGGNPQKLADAGPATSTGPAVQALLDAGARYIGRTQTDELTFSLMGQNAHFPQPINPAAPDRVTGGSSSGSAAAVAGGLCDVALGSDTGGSIRAPASFCGLIGLRTTHGTISLKGAMPLAPSFDTFGWFAKDIDVYEKVGAVLLAGQSKPTERQLRPLRLTALDALLLGPAEAAEYQRMVALVGDIVGEPAEAPALSQPIDDLYWIFRRLQAHEAWATHGAWISKTDRGLGPGVKERFEFGSTIDAETVAADKASRAALRQELAAVLGNDGVLVLPTVPGAAPLRNAGFDDLQAYRERALRLLCLSGLSGFPQITLPLGTIEGAPFGISLVAPAGSDMELIGIAARHRHLLPAATGSDGETFERLQHGDDGQRRGEHQQAQAFAQEGSSPRLHEPSPPTV